MITRSVTRASLVVYLVASLTLSSCHQLRTKRDILEGADDEAEQTRNVIVLVDGHIVTSTLINGVHAPRISIQLTFKNTSYTVDLTLNAYLLSPSYVERIMNEKGATYRHINQSQEVCYYHGVIRNEVHSSAAFSTCRGVKGFIVLNNSTFHIKPLQLDALTLVGLYEIKKANNDHLSQWICGINELKNKFNEIKASQRVKRQIIADSLEGKNVVELYVANDERRLKYFNGDYNSLSRSTREIVNAANLLYQPVGFFIVLVGVEHWQTDQMEVLRDSSKTLSNWHNYRTINILNKHYNDVGFLISRQSFDASVLGLASVGTMCSSKTSGGIMTAILDKSAVSGAILAHEIGHNFGLSHDSNDCYCESPDVSCIMSARASTDKPSTYFSACSKAQLKSSIDKGFDICLKDFPLNQNEHYPVCGNGILEQGEDCDCGRMPSEQCNPTCCNPSTCKLIGAAQCASGACCEVNSCQLKRVNTQCRTAIGPCDLPETCDGRLSFCPKNIYKHDGMSCSLDGVDAYCWKGMCRTHRSQCNELYGSAVSEGNSMCYQIYNTYGNVNGWCSFTISDQSYTACQAEDVMCGALQCNSNAASLVRYTNFNMQTNKKVGGFECKGALLDYGSRVENPGMTPSGAYCGPGKMCASAKCVSAQSKLDENPCPSCVHGVCTNEGRCLCDQGYYGPTCDSTEPLKSFPVGGIIGIIVLIVVLFLILLAVLSYKKGYLKSIRVPNKVAPGYPDKNVSFGDRSGQENQAYIPDPSISVISGPTMIVQEISGRRSFYPQDGEETYANFNSIKIVPSNYVKTPHAKRPNNWESNSYYPDIIPPTSPPPVPAQHYKPRLENSPKAPTKPPLPAQSLKPTSRPPLAPSASGSKPALPPASAKPNASTKVTSPPPSRPMFPPKTGPPPPPTFPSKLKPSRAAPSKPSLQSTTPDVVGEANTVNVRDLKAKFDSIA